MLKSNYKMTHFHIGKYPLKLVIWQKWVQLNKVLRIFSYLGFMIFCKMKWWKFELMLWKLNSIQMEILNDIACNFDWIENKFKFLNWIFKNWVEFKFHWRETKCKLVHKVLKICSSLPSFVIRCWKKTLKFFFEKKPFYSIQTNFNMKFILIIQDD